MMKADENRQSPAETVSRDALPEFALSVRQPWAWAIVHGGKDIENRSVPAVRNMGHCKGPVAIHAAKGMTQEEYVDAYAFMRSIGVLCPPAGALLRGGIIGRADITSVVSWSASRWFFGPRGLVLTSAQPCEFIPSVGALGLFLWKPGNALIVPAPAKWMLPKSDAEHPVSAKATADMFEQLTKSHDTINDAESARRLGITCHHPDGGDQCRCPHYGDPKRFPDCAFKQLTKSHRPGDSQ